MEIDKKGQKLFQLLRELGDEDWHTRSRAAKELGELKDPRAVEPLIQALKESTLSQKYDIIEALGNIGDMRAVESIIKYFFVDEDTAILGAEALGKIGDERAVKTLIRALNYDWSEYGLSENEIEKYIRKAARLALKQIREKNQLKK